MSYVAIFNLTYRDLIAPVFQFWGLGYRDIPSPYFLTSVVCCLVPALWMPLKFSRPSLLLFYVQYFLIFIPASFIVYYSVRPELSDPDSLLLVISMFAGLSIIQTTYLARARPIRAFRISADAFWLCFGTVILAMLLYLASTLGGIFHLVSFFDVYDLRNTMAEALKATGSRFGFYAQALLSALILPFLFATGVSHRAKWVIVPVAMGYIFLFGVGGAKAAALALVYLPLLSLILSRPQKRIAFTIAAGLSAVLILGYVTSAILPPRVHLYYVALVHFRFVTVPPLTIPQYFVFFQTHPLTHLSHVSGFNKLLHYPYDLDIPYTIGSYFYSVPVGANSGFWAGDGLAGFGVWGIPLLSVVCGAVFWLLDSVSADLDPRFVGLALGFCTVFFGNASLFTTLITGGLAPLMLLLLLAPRDHRGLIKLPSLSHLRSAQYARR
jgi:hypothetical protein